MIEITLQSCIILCLAGNHKGRFIFILLSDNIELIFYLSHYIGMVGGDGIMVVFIL